MKSGGKKEIILETAKELFSQKGYDATSMDEIAQQTDVPKSLIYYHFKNKEELLNAVINKFFNEYEQLLKDNSDTENNGIRKYFHFIKNNTDFLRIILIESLKKNNKNISVFKVVELLAKYENELTKNTDLTEDKKNHGRLVAEFFTSIVPSVMFACYQENWCNYFKTDENTSEQDFFTAYKLTHGEYHKHLKKQGDN